MQNRSADEPNALPAWPVAAVEIASGAGVLRKYAELTKPRITLLIVISTAVGYSFGSGSHFDLVMLLNAILGTALMASGAAALNQWYERDVDSRMNRTRRRPIPSGAIQPRHALYFGIALSLGGLLELFFFANAYAAALSLLTSFGYLYVYTPLKRKGPICTTLGAIPGAMPPLIGYAAASHHLPIQAWILFAILFLWQFPHFHAIAWMYRDDYKRGDIKMLAVVKPDGKALGRQVLLTLLLLIPATLLPSFFNMAGRVYFFAALLLGFAFLWFGAKIFRERTHAAARQLLLASVIYMPLLFAFLVFDNPRYSLLG
ncbi:MAG TPA: heme o synthase [Bryobacteraceae bacterium]|nr:heme o synthase [Bryobacteraceae bacterium]